MLQQSQATNYTIPSLFFQRFSHFINALNYTPTKTIITFNLKFHYTHLLFVNFLTLFVFVAHKFIIIITLTISSICFRKIILNTN